MATSQTIFFGLILFLAGCTVLYLYVGKEPISSKYGEVSNYVSGFVNSKKAKPCTPMESGVIENGRVSVKQRERLAVVPYLPAGMHQAYHFIALLYGSWKFIVDQQSRLFPGNDFDSINDVDLLAFCHPSICKELQSLCTVIKSLKELNSTNSVSKCWAIEQTFEVDIPYGPLNSFIMFNRKDINELIPRYKYILRTDNDVFITPAIYQLKPKEFLFGHGGYSDPFNMKRLKEISGRLGMTHRGRHFIGSTWCGETEFLIQVSKMTLNVSRYLFLNEFDPKAKGLETIPFDKNREGEWIRWWRPVSSLYGGEIVLNHMIPTISNKNQGNFDSSSCDTSVNIWKTPHIHCWHNDCEFQKFRFMKYLNLALNSRETLPGEVVHRIIAATYPQDITSMNLRDYSTYIAWSSVSKYLKKWFLN